MLDVSWLTHSANFWVICSAQWLLALGAALWRREWASFGRIMIISMVAGTVFGAAYDVILGWKGVFSYAGSVGPGPIAEVGLAPTQLLVNGAVSYGAAFATVFYLRPLEPDMVVSHGRLLRLAWAAVTIAAVTGLCYAKPGSVGPMFYAGVAVLAGGELACLLCGRSGPIVSLLSGQSWRALARIWLISVGMGLAYESANLAFPFWTWLPESGLSHAEVEGLIISLGYFVLLHPMCVFWATCGIQRRQREGELL